MLWNFLVCRHFKLLMNDSDTDDLNLYENVLVSVLNIYIFNGKILCIILI
jgi:hypothetical protein